MAAGVLGRTVVMLRGNVVGTGTIAGIFAASEQPDSRALLVAVLRLDAMAGRERPMRFPAVDRASGNKGKPTQTPDTVRAGKRQVREVRDVVTRFEFRGGLVGRATAGVRAVVNGSFVQMLGLPARSRSPTCLSRTTGRW